tara:strand:- start:33 stop:287 length:255 start_codon:yes stop_codon:yes gene_type:complete
VHGDVASRSRQVDRLVGFGHLLAEQALAPPLRGERREEVVDIGDRLVDVFVVVGGVELLVLVVGVSIPCDDAAGRRAAAGAGSA